MAVIARMIENSDVGDILVRAVNGERLDVEDGIRLFESNDVAAVGAVADMVRRRINGDRTYYVVNRHINYTDICKNRCAFCAFSRDAGDDRGYVMTVDEVVSRAADYYEDMKFTELHIVGGLHPTLSFEYYTDMLSALKSHFPQVHLQAFTAVEIAHIAEIGGMTVREALCELRDAGLGSIPGGGAEVFSSRVRERICPEKVSGDEWLEVMRQAHALGLRSNATMLYGHVETSRERVEHMMTVRQVQDETGGFMTFIPLKFHPSRTAMGHLAAPSSAEEDLKVYAVSRLLIDNIPHIKVFWIMMGVKLGQVALSFGADDFDGTVVEEKITHRAGARTPEALSVAQLRRLIEETGTIPVERDTLYNEVTRNEAGLPAIS